MMKLMNNIYSNEYKKLLKKLKEARAEVGLSQKQVAAKLGKPQSFISKSETGERRLDVIEIKEFADLYRKPINYFME